ncbi:MAG: glycosyltransferase family 2 protein [Saprospiraceae bacterium]|nr:glycosyltransferase family 2 protein [Saprospiraceae bacterium]
MTDNTPQISIVIPLYNEEESLRELADWIQKVMRENDFTYEIIFVDDGSTDKSWEVIGSLSSKSKEIKGIKFKRNYGKSAALQVGFTDASGKVVITMDADLQDSPDEIPALYKMITEDGYDLVSGWKKKRYDPLSKTIPTKLFNAATRKMSGIKLNDFNCGLKAYRGNVVHAIEVYGEMHRYIPVIAKEAGFGKIGERVVQHRERKYGVTKFGLNRFINGFLDLLSIFFVGKFGKKPMHFFGTLGVIAFFIGFVILIELSIEKIFFNVGGIAERPLFFLGMLATIIGTQLFVTGFLAELVSRNSATRNNYLIEEKISL